MVRDMTKRVTGKDYIYFTMPMLISIIFQQMYNIADSVIAGKFIGMNALAAVGISSPVTFIFLAFATGRKHRVLGHCQPVVWSQSIRRDENCCLYLNLVVVRSQPSANRYRSVHLRPVAAAGKYAR